MLISLRKVILLTILVFGFTNSFSQSYINSFYYPLQIGNKWSYSNTFFRYSEEIIDTMRINGVLYYGFATWSTEQAEYWLRNDNAIIKMLNMKDSLEFKLFDFNAEVGESWELPLGYECSFGTEVSLTSITDTIITPADTFVNCYHFNHTPHCFDAGIHDTWFADGIGKVRYIADNIAGMMDYKLIDFTIITGLIPRELPVGEQTNQLYQNYPNPFNSVTIIPYFLLRYNYVSIKFYNILGQEILSLINDFQNAGFHFFTFDAEKIPNGTYFYQLEIDNQYISMGKMLYLK